MWKRAIITLAFMGPVMADVGGHDLFTSLAQLEVLWRNEMEVIQIMENAIGQMERASQVLKE